MKQLHILLNCEYGGGEAILSQSECALPNEIEVNYIRYSKKIAHGRKIYLTGIDSKQAYSIIDQILNIFICLFAIMKVKKQKQDVIVLHGYPFQFIIPLLAMKIGWRNLKLVFHQRKEHKNHMYKFLAVVELLFIWPFPVYAVSASNRKYISTYFFNLKKIKLFELPYFEITKSDIYQPQSRCVGRKEILTIGRFDKVKGHNRLVSWVNENRSKLMEYKFILIGDGPLKKEIELQIKKLKLEDYFLLVGHKDRQDLYDFYQSADAVISPSFSEAAPVTFIEAIQFKKINYVFEKGLRLHDNNILIDKFFEKRPRINWSKSLNNMKLVREAFSVFQ